MSQKTQSVFNIIFCLSTFAMREFCGFCEPMNRLEHGSGRGHGHSKHIYIYIIHVPTYIIYVLYIHIHKYYFYMGRSHRRPPPLWVCGACAGYCLKGKKNTIIFYYNWTSIKKCCFMSVYYIVIICSVLLLYWPAFYGHPRNQVVCELTHTTKILLWIGGAKSSIVNCV